MTPPGKEALDLFTSAERDRVAEGDEPFEAKSSREGGGPSDHPASVDPGGPEVWTVSEVNRTARRLLETGLPALWVAGEVANWTKARSGHRYFTLKDDRAQLRCVMWKRDAARLPVDPEEGMRVRAFGSLTLYEARGEYQLSVQTLEGEGQEGLWRLAFERLRARLEQEGHLDPSRRRPLPRLPGSVGVVTSPTGAALRDILSVIGRRAPWTRVVVRGARVQGEGAAEAIAQGIRVLGESGEVEVMIVGRGGGSIEDLWAFNEEPVARAIVSCPVPVISAVGHEVDVTISDLVADLRAPTPSAAGEAVVPDRIAILEQLEGIEPRLIRALRSQAGLRRIRLQEARSRMIRGIQRILEPRRAVLERRADRLTPAMRGVIVPSALRVEGTAARMGGAIRALVDRRRERLARLAGKVEALSPLSTLRRGYAVPLGPEGTVLRRARDFRHRPRFQLRVVDGRIQCETKDVEEEADT